MTCKLIVKFNIFPPPILDRTKNEQKTNKKRTKNEQKTNKKRTKCADFMI